VTQHTGPPIARDEIVPATPSGSHSLLAFSGLSFKPPAYLQRAVLRRTRSWLWNEQSANNSPPNQWNYPLTSPFLAVFERIPRTDETCNLVCQPPRTVFLFFLLPCSENPIEPNIAGFSDRLWSQMSTLVNSHCSTNRISDCSEERGSRALQHPYTVCVHFGTEARTKTGDRRGQLPTAARESDATKLCLSILKFFGSEEVLVAWQDDDALTYVTDSWPRCNRGRNLR
jgi:hypothetical protein